MAPRPRRCSRTVDAFHGAADKTAPYDAARRVVEVFQERGYPAAMHAYPGLKHDFSAQERAELLAYAAQRLRGDRSPCHDQPASGASY